MRYYDAEFETLFEELGLDNDPDSIDRFIEKNKIYNNDLHIADAPFWNQDQSEYIRESIYHDGALADAVDQLDIILRN